MRIIEGIDRYRIVEPMFEAVRVILHHRGEPISPAYVQGIAGTAFTIGGICPCAPTCVTVPYDAPGLLRLFGYDCDTIPYRDGDPDADAQFDAFLRRLKSEIDAGRPVIVWNAFTSYENDVVCGYDDASETLHGYGSYAGGDELAVSPWDRCKAGMDVTDTIAVTVDEKRCEIDAPAAETAALRFAVTHARSQEKNAGPGAFHEGLACYRGWEREWADPLRKRQSGDSYCLGVLSSTRRAAADFMNELSVKYPAAALPLAIAASAFSDEADALDALKPLLGWSAPGEPDADRSRTASEGIGQAARRYGDAIDAIEAALEILSPGSEAQAG